MLITNIQSGDQQLNGTTRRFVIETAKAEFKKIIWQPVVNLRERNGEKTVHTGDSPRRASCHSRSSLAWKIGQLCWRALRKSSINLADKCDSSSHYVSAAMTWFYDRYPGLRRHFCAHTLRLHVLQRLWQQFILTSFGDSHGMLPKLLLTMQFMFLI